MATVKMTFSLDETTAARLTGAASLLRKPKSEVVRDAILEYADRVDRLTDGERQHLLRVLDELMASDPTRSVDGRCGAARAPSGAPRGRPTRSVVIIVDTSALIDSLMNATSSGRLRALIADGERPRLAVAGALRMVARSADPGGARGTGGPVPRRRGAAVRRRTSRARCAAGRR
ncbi:MAG: ribbon-helix-helix protein, CopG family [Chloroflexota bacterium]